MHFDAFGPGQIFSVRFSFQVPYCSLLSMKDVVQIDVVG